MPNTRKPTPLDRDDMSTDHLMVVIGKLLEATKSATEGVQQLALDARQNATAILTVAKTMESLESTVRQLDNVVRNNPDALVKSQAEIKSLKEAVAELDGAVVKLREDMGAIGTARAKLSTVNHMVYYLIIGLAWSVTTVVALIGAIRK